MKRVVFGFLVLIFFGSSVFAVQKTLSFPGTELDADFALHDKTLYNGWNLIYGLPSPDWIEIGDVSKENIKAIYSLDPINQAYIRFYPNPETDKISNSNFAWSEYLKTTAFFVYVDYPHAGGGNVRFWALESGDLINGKPLFKGWNFIGITDGFVDKTIGEIKGNCQIERLYGFDKSELDQDGGGRWDEIEEDVQIPAFILGSGFLVKVSNDCNLVSTGIISPPNLPGSNSNCLDSDGGLNYFVKGTVKGKNEDGPAGISSATDMCEGDTLYEFFCKNSNEYDDESYVCPKGCNDGVCLQ